MAARLGIAACLSLAMIVAVGLGPAVAQGLPTVSQVDEDLDVACAFTGAGVVVDRDACLAAVDRAILAAGGYAALPQVQPQIDIGYLLCLVILERTSLATAIVQKIDDSGNAYLALGCTNALGPDWVGPRPIVSPA